MSVNQFLNGKLNLIAGAGGGSVIADDNTFTGTTAEVEAAIADGLIEDDTIVFITDDVDEGEAADVLDTYDEIMANEEENQIPGALGVKEGFEKVDEKINILEENSGNTIVNSTVGESIHLTNAADNKVAEFALYGKARQNTTIGKNLLPSVELIETTHNGVTFTPIYENGLLKYINVNGIASEEANFSITPASTDKMHGLIPNTSYIGSVSDSNVGVRLSVNQFTTTWTAKLLTYTSSEFTITDDAVSTFTRIQVLSGTKVDNVKVYPMIRLATDTNDTYEPYTNGPSPNPDYPQEIEVAGESYNLLENTATSQIINGVTVIVNDDGSVTVNGTATDNATFLIGRLNMKKGVTYKLSDGKKGGVNGTPNTFIVYGYNSEYNWVINNYTKASSNTTTSTEIYTPTQDETINFHIRIVKGHTVNNETIYPMLRKASVKNDRYIPYGKDSVEVKSVGKNLLPYPYYQSNLTENEISYMVNVDGSVTANGTANDASFFRFRSRVETDSALWLEPGDYILSGVPSNVTTSEPFIWLGTTNDDETATFLVGHYGSETNGKLFTLTKRSKIHVQIVIAKGITVNNLTFKPMIRLASDTDNTYEPYKEISTTLPILNGLTGIPVDNGGNYTDENGQQWITDEIIKYADGSGAYVQRCINIVNENMVIKKSNLSTENYLVAWVDSTGKPLKRIAISTHFSQQFLTTPLGISSCIFIAGNSSPTHISIPTSIVSNVNNLKTWLLDNNVKIYYPLAEPITIPLTAEQMSELDKVSTFSPITNMSNDFDCGMYTKYYTNSEDGKLVADLSNKIDNVQNFNSTEGEIIYTSSTAQAVDEECSINANVSDYRKFVVKLIIEGGTFSRHEYFASDINNICNVFMFVSGTNLIQNCHAFKITSTNKFLFTYKGYNNTIASEIIGYK